jgi:hypothetical protein
MRNEGQHQGDARIRVRAALSGKSSRWTTPEIGPGGPADPNQSNRRIPMISMSPRISDVPSELRQHWKLFLFQGIVMIILGALAVAAPAVATVAVDIYVGWLFLISGVVGLVAMFSSGGASSFLWTLVTALLSLAVGVLLIW